MKSTCLVACLYMLSTFVMSNCHKYAKEVYKKDKKIQKFYQLPKDNFSVETKKWIEDCAQLEDKIAELAQKIPTQFKKRIPRTMVEQYLNECHIPLQIAHQDSVIKRTAKGNI